MMSNVVWLSHTISALIFSFRSFKSEHNWKRKGKAKIYVQDCSVIVEKNIFGINSVLAIILNMGASNISILPLFILVFYISVLPFF